MSQIQDEARERARRVLSDYGAVTAPIPVEKIIKKLGIRIQFSPLDQELSGMALVKDDISVIGVNALHHPNRQRFTMAHELGHHIMHHEQLQGTVHVDKGFAVCRNFILKRIVKMHIDIDALMSTDTDFKSQLQIHCQKNKLSLEYRLVNEVQKGYLLNGRLLRPSKVCICKKMNKENNVCE